MLLSRIGFALGAMVLALLAYLEPAAAGALIAAAPLTFPVRARTLEELGAMAEPQNVPGGQSEALPWVLFDTALYDSAATTQLTFFTSARATPRFSNLNGRGLPTPQYFEVYYFTLDFLVAPAVAGEPIQDMWALINGVAAGTAGTPTWKFTLADKQMGPFPLRTLHSAGSVSGYTSNTTEAYANNSDPTGAGTFCADGSIVIPPNQTFSIDLDWPAALTLDGGDVQVQVGMYGVLHRRVL